MSFSFSKRVLIDLGSGRVSRFLSFSRSNLFVYLMFIAVGFSAIMANVSVYNAHPDEKQHVEAGKFYVDNWLPPKVGDPRAQDSYSIYGDSRLNDPDIVYFLAGKFSVLISPVVSEPHLRFRLFNVTLFLILAVLCAVKIRDRLVFLVLLLSPQIWYVFSYFNGDAFPLFLSILIVYQFISDESLFNKYIKTPAVFGFMGGGLLMGVYVGLLALSKINYYIFLLFILCWFIWSVFGFRVAILCLIGGVLLMAYRLNYLDWLSFSKTKYYIYLFLLILFLVIWSIRSFNVQEVKFVNVLKYGVVILIALAIFVPRYVYSVVKNSNGMTRVEVAERFAKPQYKPSTSIRDTFFGLRLKEKGVKYTDLFSPPWNWHLRAAFSAAGVYGWFSIWGPRLYYRAILLLYAAFLGFVCINVILLGGKGEVAFITFVGLFTLALLFILSYHSWTSDFQGQGRHFFPIVGMLAMLLGRNKDRLHEGVLSSFVLFLFCFSFYSFVFTGLRGIPK